MTNDDIKAIVIADKLDVLHGLLQEAGARTAEAHALMKRGERNAAMGSILGLDELLADASALYRIALVFHRMKR